MAKGIWFFFPMGIALLVNSVAFVSMVLVVVKQDKRLKDLKIDTNKDQGELNRQRYVFC